MDTRKKVLLVDRNNAVCHCVRKILNKETYDIDFVNNARDAFIKIQNNTSDLVLFDGDSLGTTVSEFISLIKDCTNNIPGIVAMINSREDGRGPYYAQLAVDDLIIKPLNATELRYRVHRVVNLKSSARVFNKDKAVLEISKVIPPTLRRKKILHTMVKKVASRIDVTDNASLCENLKSTRLRLIQSERLRALGELAAGVAHNFNNVLSGILGHTQMLLSKDVDAEICKRLQIIERLVLDGSAVVRRVQEFTKIRTTGDFVPVDVNDIVSDVVKMTESKWSGWPNTPRIAVLIDMDSMAIPVIEGNASELREVFINILFNAVDAMPKGGELTIQTKTKEKNISVCFFDTGEGMSLETKKRVFDPFFTTKGSKGMGLGMSVAYEIVNRHNGQIHIDSEPGVGTAVTVQLPVSEKLIQKKAMENKSRLKQGGKMKMLLMEENEITPEVLAENFIN